MSKQITIRHDKFHAKTEMKTKTVTLWSGNKAYDYGLSWQRNDIKGSFRHWSTPDGDSILLDIDYVGKEWLFLQEGDIVIRVNNSRNITLTPVETGSKVSSDENAIHVHESLYYEISNADFDEICKADMVEIQITGKNTFVEGNGVALLSIGRILYNAINGSNILPIVEVQSNRGLFLYSIIAAVIMSLYIFVIEEFSSYGNLNLFGWLNLILVAINIFAYFKTKAYLNKLFTYTYLGIFALLIIVVGMGIYNEYNFYQNSSFYNEWHWEFICNHIAALIYVIGNEVIYILSLLKVLPFKKEKSQTELAQQKENAAERERQCCPTKSGYR